LKIKIKLFSILRELADRKEDIVEVEDGTDIGRLILILQKRYGAKFGQYVLDGEAIRPYIKVMVNGRDIEFLGGLKAKIEDGDIIQMIPPVRGG